MFKQLLRITALMTAASMFFAIAPASAEKPAERIKFTDEFSDTDPFFAAGCGIDTVLVDGVAKVQLNFFEDGSARIHENVKITFTNPDTGDQVFLSIAQVVHDAPVAETLDGDLLTIVFQATHIGNAQKWQAPGVGVIVRDTGQITIRTTLVIDTTINPEEADPVVSFDDEIVGQNGPHPYADQGFFFNDEQLGQICTAMGGSVQPMP